MCKTLYREFLAENPVFSTGDFARHCETKGGPQSPSGQQAALRRLVTNHDVIHIRKGFYESTPDAGHSGPYMSNCTGFVMRSVPDAVISHHSALTHRGLGYTFCYGLIYSSSAPRSPWRRGNLRLVGTLHPKALRDAGQTQFDVMEIEQQGMRVRVTDRARTMVDCLRRPELAMGWEEIWRCYEMCAYRSIDTERMAEYVQLLGDPFLAAKTGFLMETKREIVPCADGVLAKLQAMVPQRARYLCDREATDEEGAILVQPWNLVVPEGMFYETWSQFN